MVGSPPCHVNVISGTSCDSIYDFVKCSSNSSSILKFRVSAVDLLPSPGSNSMCRFRLQTGPIRFGHDMEHHRLLICPHVLFSKITN